MDTNKMREQFEAAFVERQVGAFGEDYRSTAQHMLKREGDFDEPPTAYKLHCRNRGMYDTYWVEMAWWAWQASREAVVVELPTACAYEGLTEHLGCVIELTYERPEHDPVGLARIPDVRSVIEAHGLKVAGHD